MMDARTERILMNYVKARLAPPAYELPELHTGQEPIPAVPFFPKTSQRPPLARTITPPVGAGGWSLEALGRQANDDGSCLAKAYLGLFHCASNYVWRDVNFGRGLLQEAVVSSKESDPDAYTTLQNMAKFWIEGDRKALKQLETFAKEKSASTTDSCPNKTALINLSRLVCSYAYSGCTASQLGLTTKPKADPKKQAALLQLGASTGDVPCSARLGWSLHYGRGVVQDHHKAYELFLLAGESGLADGQVGVGMYHQSGLAGLEKDYSTATSWYHLAAAQGNAVAQCCLGLAAEYGLATQRDPSEARRWYTLSAGQGYEGASEALERLTATQKSE